MPGRSQAQARELRVTLEPADSGGFADDLGGDEHTAALEAQQLRGIVGDRERDLALELVCLTRELTAAACEITRDPGRNALFGPCEPPRDSLEPDLPARSSHAGHQLWGGAHDPLVAGEQEALEAAAHRADILERPDSAMLGGARASGELVEELTAAGPEGNGGMRPLVRVNSSAP